MNPSAKFSLVFMIYVTQFDQSFIDKVSNMMIPNINVFRLGIN